MTRMWMALRRGAGTGALAVVLMLACGAAVAGAAQTQPALVGSVQNNPTPGSPVEDLLSGTVAVATENTSSGWYAYTPAYYNGDLTAINLTDPTTPTIAGSGGPPSAGTQLYASDTVNIFNGIAYVVSKNRNGPCSGTVGSSTCNVNDDGSGNALTLFDVHSDPNNPQYLGSVSDASLASTTLFGAYGVTVTTINGQTFALVASQGCLNGQPCPGSYVGDPNNGNDLALFNVSSPTSIGAPTGVVANGAGGLYDDLDHPTAVAVSGHYAYVTSFYGDAFTVVDISDPTHPTVVTDIRNTTDFPAPADVAIQGNYAYVINQSGGGPFTVVDISNPTAPTVVGTTSAVGLNSGYRVRVSGDLAYVSSRGKAAITAVDITNPAAPFTLTSLVDTAHLNATTGLDLMDVSGSEYVVASSPYLSTESNYTYPTYPSFDNTTQLNTGTISAIQLDPVANTVTIATSSEPSTGGQPYTTSTSASFSFSTSDAVSSVACSLDGAAYGPCTSETTAQYSSLSLGQHTFSVRSTDGAGNVSSASYAWTVKAPPANTALPVVSGSTVVGGTLSTTTGSWNGSPTSYSYQWQRCDAQGASCVNVSSTGASYTTGSADLGSTLRVAVTAGNLVGSATATSAATAAITAAQSGGSTGGTTGTTSTGGTSTGSTSGNPTPPKVWLTRALRSMHLPRIAVLLKKNGLSSTLGASSYSGRMTITWYATVAHHRVVVARGTVALKAGARARVVIKLTAAGRALLRKFRPVKITISGRVVSAGGNASAVRTVSIRR